ncbi:hypothetical protein NDU88_001700 [Pleurodeles waltl]|uniref:Uncharacterized protein n=1 Tax=Pleurodeles waltl TaxID=8319 RepID=A0AAV7UTH4_PLEWA|nr:hypothetical protein NDU88_001700 [Pleurodeles waltl]
MGNRCYVKRPAESRWERGEALTVRGADQPRSAGVKLRCRVSFVALYCGDRARWGKDRSPRRDARAPCRLPTPCRDTWNLRRPPWGPLRIVEYFRGSVGV